MMQGKLCLSLFVIRNVQYRPILLRLILLTAIVDPLLLIQTQCIVDLFGNLEFEVDRNMRA